MARKFAAIGVVIVAFAAAAFGVGWWYASPPAAVYLSIGDGTQYGCCGKATKSSPELFRRYLSNRLERDVAWVTEASGYQTSATFMEGHPEAGIASQFDRSLQLIEQYGREQKNVAAITLSIGGNDLVEMGAGCPPTAVCLVEYNAALIRMKANLETIYSRIADAKDPKTPLLVVLYYNASDCGQPGVESSPAELGVRGWNDAIGDIATRHGATLVDLHDPFAGKACKYIVSLDANDAGHVIIGEAYKRAYEMATK